MKTMKEELTQATRNGKEVLIEFDSPVFNHLHYVTISEMEFKENSVLLRGEDGSETELIGIEHASLNEEDGTWCFSKEDNSFIVSVIGD